MPIFKTEKEFENQVCDYIYAHKVNPINSREVIGIARQPNLGEYGIADIITLEKHGEKRVINVIEMKNTQFQAGMIFQIGRYLEAVKLGINYKLLPTDLIRIYFFGDEDIKVIFDDVKAIGSLVCPDFGELEITQGIKSVFNQLDITIYSADLELLSIMFSPLNDASNYQSDQIDKIQESLKPLNFTIDCF